MNLILFLKAFFHALANWTNVLESQLLECLSKVESTQLLTDLPQCHFIILSYTKMLDF